MQSREELERDLSELIEIIDNLEIGERLGKLSKKEQKELENLRSEFKGKLRELNLYKVTDQLVDNYENVDLEIRTKYDFLKSQNLKLHRYYEYFYNKKDEQKEKIYKITDKKLERVKTCNGVFTAVTDVIMQKSKIVKTYKCQDKFCPLCQKIKATKNALSIQVIYDYLKDVTNYNFIFVTLTAPNIKASKLKDELEDYQRALKVFFQNQNIKKINKGYIAKLEITYNSERDDYHPHYHIIMAVPGYYFDNVNYYLSREKWLNLWRSAKKDDSITQVDVRKVQNKNSNGVSSEILELSKYIAKSSDFLMTLDIFENYYNLTYRKRFYKYGGIFRDALKKFKAGELEKYKNEDMREWEFIIDYCYDYSREYYDKTNLRKLTEEEKAKIKLNEIKNLEKEFDLD